MDNIQIDFSEKLKQFGIAYDILTKQQAVELEVSIRTRFCDSSKKSVALWEALTESQCYSGEGETDWIENILSTKSAKAWVLIDDWHGYSAVLVQNISQLTKALGDMYNFKWYITDLQLTYLLCRNDHDILILCQA